MPKLAVFDEEYARKRDWLIPVAEKHANENIHLPRKCTDIEASAWNMVFLAKMDELAREAGLVN